ncbi:MAG TPA: hypothetical protein VN231_05670 [Allosphingosinicella sp.]|nr:hypothetical protein [Allosphingosinicella sp.]
MILPLVIAPSKRRRIALAALTLLPGPLLLVSPAAGAASAIESTDRGSYVLFTEGSRSTMMSGSTEDLHRARSVRVGQEGLLYVRRGGEAFVIRDSETLRRAAAIFEPQQALGAQQAELGSRQAALGQRQARLGAAQAELGRQQAGASPRRAEELGRRQDALARQQDALGRQQDALGREQDALGREQDRLAGVADARLRDLVAEAFQSGLARRVD